MIDVDFLITDSEMKTLTNYAVKSFGGLSAAGVTVDTETIIPVTRNAFVKGYRCKLSLPIEADNAQLLVKVSGGHIQTDGLPSKEQLLGRSKFILRDNLGDNPLDMTLITREQRLFMDRLQATLSERSLLGNSNVMILTTDFVAKSHSLLRRHFLIDGAVDSINATSDAVFNHCLGVSTRSYKAQHWMSYLDNSGENEPISAIFKQIMNTALINPSINTDISDLLNQKYIDRNQASRLASVIDSSLLSTSVRIREDFSCQVMGFEPSSELKTFKGVVFGVCQNISNGKPRFALRIKSNSGQLLEVESGSEYFGGLITKADVLDAVKNEKQVSIQGSITSVNNGIKIGDRVLFPAITSISAKKIEFEYGAPIIERQQTLIGRKFG
ncbi:hypothetical protein OTK49_00050 [Vibrio coralliirubri]|uniref:hypothetical protein n=1 Tax=Vibrio coralliirubri TaxID=1516159 RepID=UPI0022843136|nr:hypothetical protein [Vibrio coralliirubri]MCY9860931.1 hypothetical protein [Vibrio coralliirubri]